MDILQYLQGRMCCGTPANSDYLIVDTGRFIFLSMTVLHPIPFLRSSSPLPVALLLFIALPAFAQRAVPPKREVRAVWLATNGLDWPHSTDKAEQQASLKRIVSTLKASHFNTIFFQVRARGDAYYRSSQEPWAENLTGILGKDPGWDPLEFLLNEAHAAGMEVHAWFNVFKVRGTAPVGPSIVPHPSRAHSMWCVSSAGELWFDPGIPEVRTYLLNVAMELIRNYDLDGINLDYCRYPGRDFQDELTYRRYGQGKERDSWRRENVTAFVSELYDRATALKPMLKVGSSPLGVYNGDIPNGPQGSYSSTYQDSKGWLHAGKQDYLAPQLYWVIGAGPAEPDYLKLLRRWAAQPGPRQLYAGIGAYKPEILRQLPVQIDSARSSGMSGVALFRYENTRPDAVTGNRFTTMALVPPMAWKDSIPPLPPASFAVSEIAPSVYQLEWTPPAAAADGDRPHRYVVYRWTTPDVPTNDPRAIVAVVPDTSTVLVDTISSWLGLRAYYAVSSLDKGNNESIPSTVVSATPREALALEGKLSRFTTLVTSISNGDGKPAFAGYHLEARMPVLLELRRPQGRSPDTVVATIVNGMQDQGMYVYGLRNILHDPGHYLLRLKAGGTVIDQDVEVLPKAPQ